jgi:ribonuclease P protein component
MHAGAPIRLRLGRKQRLLQNRDFMRVRQQGQRLAVGCVIANWQLPPAGAGPRLGVVTSKKIGNAVARNRARRWLRESFRRHQHELVPSVELVLVARPSIAGCDYARVEKDFLTSVRRAGLFKPINS